MKIILAAFVGVILSCFVWATYINFNNDNIIMGAICIIIDALLLALVYKILTGKDTGVGN